MYNMHYTVKQNTTFNVCYIYVYEKKGGVNNRRMTGYQIDTTGTIKETEI